jgi:hypothetical protein
MVLAAAAVSSESMAEPAMAYIHSAAQSGSDRTQDFYWEILKTALEKTSEKYGPFKLETTEYMSEPRQVREMTEATGRITVMLMGTNAELERDLAAIHIPVDKNLSGLFVLLVKSGDHAKSATVQFISNPGGYSIGLSSRSMVNAVFAHNGFHAVSRGTSYEGLFEMLSLGRFNALPRSVSQYAAERDLLEKSYPGLAVEGTILLSCTWPVYFWFSKTQEGRLLARRAGEGMWRMIEDGTYDGIFNRYFQGALGKLGLENRRNISMENPLSVPETPINDKALWYAPGAGQGK